MRDTKSWFIISLSLLIATLLTLMPMPVWTVWLRPAWVLMVIAYWVMILPHRVGLGIAWAMGILLDILSGTLLGEHALALTVVTYLVIRLYSRLRMFPLVQQALVIFLFVLLYQFILFCIQGFIGQPPQLWLHWLPALTSMVLWPWLFIILRNCRRRFRVI